jgi:hypothetical protein
MNIRYKDENKVKGDHGGMAWRFQSDQSQGSFRAPDPQHLNMHIEGCYYRKTNRCKAE